MHETANEFKNQALEKYNFEVDIHEFLEGTKTAKDAAKAIGCDVAQIAKSIVMKANDNLVIVITSGKNRVSEKKLGTILNKSPEQIRTAHPEEIKRKTGWSIGGVPPFCHKNNLKVILDETLTQFEQIWTAAGTPNTVFPIKPKKLKEYSNAKKANIAE
uniref:YbaK/prolyl-tRNA synthetase associated region protein n=1 Tax=uncultured organism TaxID=155900 RepID=M1PPX8_9ZZZZ|nr:YbaK/prolyl-tRNA synthetase associated region protein [uncultured organism]